MVPTPNPQYAARPPGPGVAPRDVLAEAARLSAAIRYATQVLDSYRSAARLAHDTACRELAWQQLWAIPVDRLREITADRVPLGPVEGAGFNSVGSVLAAGYRLQYIPRVGPAGVTRILAAAQQLETAVHAEARVRFDPNTRPSTQTQLLAALYVLDRAERSLEPVEVELPRLLYDLGQLAHASHRTSSRLRMWFSSAKSQAHALAALGALHSLLQAPNTHYASHHVSAALLTFGQPIPDAAGLWYDYEQRAAAYNSLLARVAGSQHGVAAEHGYAPADIVERVQAQPLDTTALRVRLRGYQAFGAKFALVQGRVVLGDEMGLGKTIEALAVMAHLHSLSARHFLVVCPASVMVNWSHEVARHSSLFSHQLHGESRLAGLNAWAAQGGVAITTYDTLKTLPTATGVRIALLVVDEAHYVKNPEAGRTKAVRNWVGLSDRTLFLTGTPMENRVEEFKTVVGHLRPDIAQHIPASDVIAGGARFRSTVAPVYLRRNQEDVLDELPPLIEMAEWVEFAPADEWHYREAVASRNFMAMRRAAYEAGATGQSAKLARLVEIVRDVLESGQKVVVFSFFRDVLDRVMQSLGEVAVGPMTGSVPAPARQQLIDHFTAHDRPCVLVSQIEAGGVGLNIQAASAVVLTEPQWKPSTEAQAIARCHRMGQVRPVSVHRILAVESVDARMLAVLAKKASLFDEYVRRSALKESAPAAVDVSDVLAARQVASQAEAERRIIELECERLGIGVR